MTDPPELLLLDFGGVCILNPVELHWKAERDLDLGPGALKWLGPIDPSTDPLWQELVSGDGINEREYWAERAHQVGEMAGRSMTTADYMNVLYTPASDAIVRPACNEVVARVQAANIRVSVLTNDLAAFHGKEWQEGIPLLQRIDHLVDCSDTGILKPDPRAYQRAVDITGVPADKMLFVDDQPGNVDGARAFGIETIWFDIAKADDSWNVVADRLGV